MASWAAQQAIRNIILVAVVGGGLYGLYRFIDQQGRTAPSGDHECRAERGEILATCEEACAKPGDSPMPVQIVSHGEMDPECLDKCSMQRFGKPIPVCSSRR